MQKSVIGVRNLHTEKKFFRPHRKLFIFNVVDSILFTTFSFFILRAANILYQKSEIKVR